jgi:hypothetical protein
VSQKSLCSSQKFKKCDFLYDRLCKGGPKIDKLFFIIKRQKIIRRRIIRAKKTPAKNHPNEELSGKESSGEEFS